MNDKVLKVTMICVAGLSTNFLSNKVQIAAREKHQKVVMTAISEVYVSDEITNVDVILIAPQIEYLYDEILTYIDTSKTVVKILPRRLYGTMDGKKVLLFINECIKERA